ncbi:arsenate reductase/protein-tyrosine-phosphatase family protein [Amycolatopsis alkalitolerans]|nr:hypothetical protein [Amycolatopsis alkalitolerans]
MPGGKLTDPFRILFVSTANVCRSPVAELVCRQLLRTALGASVARFGLSSAGTHAAPGVPMDGRAVRLLVSRGLGTEARAFGATQLTAHRLRAADLVLTAGWRHRSAVLALEPAARDRSFCLLELIRLLSRIDAPGLPRDPLARARVAVESGRQLRDEIGHQPRHADEVPDPAALSDYGYAVSVSLVESAVHRFVRFLQPVTCSPEVPA